MKTFAILYNETAEYNKYDMLTCTGMGDITLEDDGSVYYRPRGLCNWRRLDIPKGYVVISLKIMPEIKE